eukprot:PITA_14248
MVEEYSSIMVNDVWEVVPRPQDKSVVASRWIYKVKYVADDSVEKYKAGFVAKGYDQKEGIDYEETFTPVARYISIRTVTSLVAQMGWEIHYMDVKTTFLNEVIEEEVYIEQPEGFETYEKKSHARQRLQEELSHRIHIKDLGQMNYFLGLEVWKQKGEIFLGQGRYATEILKRFRMPDYTPMATLMITNWKNIDALEDKEVDPTLYRQLIWSLMYLVNTTT